MKRWQIALSMGFVLCAASQAGQSVEPILQLDIQSLPMSDALNELARQSGLQVVIDWRDSSGLMAPPLVGPHTPTAALQELLANTSLEYEFINERTVAIRSTKSRSVEPTGGIGRISGGAAALRLAQTYSASAQSSPEKGKATAVGESKEDDKVSLEEILVTAQRQDEQRSVKQNSIQIVEAIGRTAIDDSPARSVADLIRQIPGITMGTDQGEPRGGTIRGLSYSHTTIDGREVLMAGQRSLEAADVAVDLLDSIEVYKTVSANMVEGGMSALINMKMREPLSYDDFHITGLATAIHDASSSKTKPNGDVVIGNKWSTGIGEIAVIAGWAGVTNNFRNDFALNFYRTSSDHFDLNGNGALGDPADAAVVPLLNLGRFMGGYRERYLQNFQVQWKPHEALEFHGTYMGMNYKDSHYHYGTFNFLPGSNSLALSREFSLRPGTNIVERGTFANTSIEQQGIYDPHRRRVDQGSIGTIWTPQSFKVAVNVDYTKSKSRDDSNSITLVAIDPAYTTYTARRLIGYSYGGLDPTNPTDFSLGSFNESRSSADSKHWAERVDVEYEFDDGFLSSLQVGLRLTQRDASQRSGSRSSSLGGLSVANYAGYMGLSWDDFLPNSHVGTPRWTAFDPYKLENIPAIRALLGTPGTEPASSPANDFHFKEKTSAAYVRGLYEFSLGGLPVDGDIGVRVVRTETVARGNLIATDGSFTPNTQRGSYTNVLPSANLRFHLTDDINLRLAGSTTVTRPGFADLAPAITLGNNAEASGGNPALEAFTSKGADLTLEWYHSDAGFVFSNVFYKKLDGFIESRVTPEIINGASTIVRRPYNAGSGSVQGVEIGFNERFVFLPGILQGLGIDANVAYVDGELTNSLGVDSPILSLSPYVINSSLYFEYQKFSARLNYSWRDENIEGSTVVDGSIPGNATWAAESWMDVSARYRLNEHFEFVANATNIAFTDRGTYNGKKEFGLPGSVFKNHPRYELGARVRF